MNQQLQMKMQLQQKLTPQLIQSLQLLQLPLLDLEQQIQTELVSNPFLEEAVEDEKQNKTENLEEFVTPEVEEKELNKNEQFDWDTYIEAGFDKENYRRRGREITEDYTMPIPDTTTRAERLLFQLRMHQLNDQEINIGQYLIGNLDENGFLSVGLEDVALSLAVELKEVERILKVVQTFEPTGIAARDIEEGLLIQLREQGDTDELTVKIIRDCFDELEKRHFTAIAKKLSITEEQVRDVLKKVSVLNPRPGLVQDEVVSAIIPDVVVDKVEDEYIVYLNDKNVPTLKINPRYRSILKGKKYKTDETKNFIVDKLNAARWLIKSIQQRRSTILKVAEYIVKRQTEFFKKGILHLKPMIMQEAADAISMHVATISRVVHGKYMQTPRGVFEFKYFFSTKIEREDRDDLSAKSVKESIKELISEENSQKPLSDQEIVELLKKDGVQLARRTVAKYRTQLNILSARYRKKV